MECNLTSKFNVDSIAQGFGCAYQNTEVTRSQSTVQENALF